MNTTKTKITSRYSRQRECILKVLADTDTHPTANYVFDMVREEIPNISLGTVYRNLSKLADEGMILRITSDGSSERYDARITPHYHISCEKCGAVEDIFIDYEAVLDKKADSVYQGQVLGHNVMFTGICKDCCKAADS